MKSRGNTSNVGAVSGSSRSGFVSRLKERGIRNPDVLAAIDRVPRHQFVDKAFARRAYEDIPLPIGFNQTISQPFIVALMSEKLVGRSTNRQMVLEIGTGCGYQTAILAQLYEMVFSIERVQPLLKRAESRLTALQVDNVELRYGDGYDGWKGMTNFDSIILTAAPECIPLKILAQLRTGGCLVSPVGKDTNQKLKIVINKHGRLFEEESLAVKFVPLVRGTNE